MQVHPEYVAVAPSYLPHGYCYLWNPPLLWTHVVSDLLIGGAYVAISRALAYLVHRARRDIPFSVVFVAFGLHHCVRVHALHRGVDAVAPGLLVLGRRKGDHRRCVRGQGGTFTLRVPMDSPVAALQPGA